jgi:hypothetical protein
MMFNWDAFLVRLRTYPSRIHRFLPPCPDEQIRAVEKHLGPVPVTLEAMLNRFNGAKLFINAGPFISLFGISTDLPSSPFEWSAEWCIDTFTPRWRAAGPNRQNDWTIAMTNYGGLILLDGGETISEWDTGQSMWLSKNLPLSEWIESIINDGEAMIADS